MSKETEYLKYRIKQLEELLSVSTQAKLNLVRELTEAKTPAPASDPAPYDSDGHRTAEPLSEVFCMSDLEQPWNATSDPSPLVPSDDAVIAALNGLWPQEGTKHYRFVEADRVNMRRALVQAYKIDFGKGSCK